LKQRTAFPNALHRFVQVTDVPNQGRSGEFPGTDWKYRLLLLKQRAWILSKWGFRKTTPTITR
jgi:hypothetical protein